MVFAILTLDIPKPKQFLLKMELKRLGQPCNYYIDLRGRVDGEVRPYDHGGKTHYMDDTAVKAFERGIKRYGRYTLGLYEEVMNTDNNYRVRHKQQTEQRLQAQAPIRFLLTFDDGPSLRGGHTDQLIDVLRSKDLHSLFFVLGDSFQARLSQSSAGQMRQLYDGQCVGVHGWEHKSHAGWADWQGRGYDLVHGFTASRTTLAAGAKPLMDAITRDGSSET